MNDLPEKFQISLSNRKDKRRFSEFKKKWRCDNSEIVRRLMEIAEQAHTGDADSNWKDAPGTYRDCYFRLCGENGILDHLIQRHPETSEVLEEARSQIFDSFLQFHEDQPNRGATWRTFQLQASGIMNHLSQLHGGNAVLQKAVTCLSQQVPTGEL